MPRACWPVLWYIVCWSVTSMGLFISFRNHGYWNGQSSLCELMKLFFILGYFIDLKMSCSLSNWTKNVTCKSFSFLYCSCWNVNMMLMLMVMCFLCSGMLVQDPSKGNYDVDAILSKLGRWELLQNHLSIHLQAQAVLLGLVDCFQVKRYYLLHNGLWMSSTAFTFGVMDLLYSLRRFDDPENILLGGDFPVLISFWNVVILFYIVLVYYWFMPKNSAWMFVCLSFGVFSTILDERSLVCSLQSL